MVTLYKFPHDFFFLLSFPARHEGPVYSSASFYFKELPLLEDDEITIKLAKLRQLELYAEYGDYLGQTLENVRKDLKAAAKASGDDEEIRKAVAVLRGPKPWVTIADELADTNMLDLRNGVDIACYRLGIDPNHMKWLIQEWASRNRTFHNRIRDQISDCSWSSIAQKLSRDLQELSNILPLEKERESYRQVLLDLKACYFNVMGDDNPDYWLPNEKATELTKVRAAKESKKNKSSQ
jgi:hypothetical protein